MCSNQDTPILLLLFDIIIVLRVYIELIRQKLKNLVIFFLLFKKNNSNKYKYNLCII